VPQRRDFGGGRPNCPTSKRTSRRGSIIEQSSAWPLESSSQPRQGRHQGTVAEPARTEPSPCRGGTTASIHHAFVAVGGKARLSGREGNWGGDQQPVLSAQVERASKPLRSAIHRARRARTPPAAAAATTQGPLELSCRPITGHGACWAGAHDQGPPRTRSSGRGSAANRMPVISTVIPSSGAAAPQCSSRFAVSNRQACCADGKRNKRTTRYQETCRPASTR